MRWLLASRCLQTLGNYYCRHIAPHLTTQFASALDERLSSFVSNTFNTPINHLASEELRSINNIADIAAERLRLPIRYKGCGLRELYDRRHAEYVGGLIQGVIPLIDHRTPKGGLILGKCRHSQAINDLFGAGSFDPDTTGPWTVLLSHGHSHLATALTASWDALQDKAVSTGVTIPPAGLIARDPDWAGFNVTNNPLTKATRDITMELELLRFQRSQERADPI